MIKNLKDYNFQNPIFTMGTFDGLHLGHQKLLKYVVKRAKEIKGESVVLTYYHHPMETILDKVHPYLITEKDLKEKYLKDFGIDHVLFLNFDKQMALMSAKDFLEEVIIKRIKAKEIVFGYDAHFGKNREGNYHYLKEQAKNYNFALHFVPPFKMDKQIIKSSLIRDLLMQGNISLVNKYLNREFNILGKVIKGKQIGRELGFPTINLQVMDKHKIIPKNGVYLTKIFLENKVYFCLTNIGFSPTIKNSSFREIETYILDFKGNLYQQEINLLFLERIRSEIKFSSKESLIIQIKNDVEKAKELVGKNNFSFFLI